MGGLTREENMAAAGALFYKIEGQKHCVTTKATQPLCLHSLDYIVPSKVSSELEQWGIVVDVETANHSIVADDYVAEKATCISTWRSRTPTTSS